MRVNPERLEYLIKQAESPEREKYGYASELVKENHKLALDLRDAIEAVKILNQLKYKTEAGEPLKNGFYA